MEADANDPRQPLLGSGSTTAPAKEAEQQFLFERHADAPSTHAASTSDEAEDEEDKMENLSRKSQWIVLAIASGGCAAFNGVFAKLYVMFLFSILRNSRSFYVYCF